MKRGTIFGINTSNPNAIQFIVSQILRVLLGKNFDQQKVEIEIKYAEFKYFSPQHYLQFLQKTPESIRPFVLPMRDFVQQERFWFKDSLRKISQQNMIMLNQLGRRVYSLVSEFNEDKFQKFYHMRQYLTKQCEFNQHLENQNILLPQQPKNIYHQYSLMGDNKTFQMIAKNQIRFDLIFKNTTPQLNGRYSYSKSAGWVRTKKTQLLKEQIDLMLSEKTFRLAMNHQDEQSVSYQDLYHLNEEIIKNKFKNVDLRLKRTLKCTKSDVIEYSLSEVYEPRKVQGNIYSFQDITQYLTEDSNVLDKYLVGKFQHFYDYKRPQQTDPNNLQTKYEIQSQFTKQGIKNFKNWAQKKQFKMIHCQIEEAIQCLYNLFFADHSVRSTEAIWMDKIMSQKSDQTNLFQNQRLSNQFGSYMHNILFEQMTMLKNNN